MKYDGIKIVQDFSTAPLNPSFEDCYHNITNNKYYIYDGTEWLEAKAQGKDFYTLKYKKSNESVYTVEEYSSYGALLERLRSNDSLLAEQEDWIIREGKAEITDRAILQQRVGDTIEEDYPLLKLAVQNSIDWQWDIVGKILPKTIVNNNVIENVVANNEFINNFFVNGITVFKKEPDVTIVITSNSSPQNTKDFQVGEEIVYNIKIQNTGNNLLKNIVITDNKNNNWSYDSLSVGEIKQLQVTHIVTQANVNNKEIFYKVTIQAEDSLLNSYQWDGHLGLNTLTVRFVSDLEEDFTEPYQQQFFEGQNYEIEIPTFPYFLYEEENLIGTMPGYNQEVKVIYSEKTYWDLTYTLLNGDVITKRFYDYASLINELDSTDGTVTTVTINEGVLE